MLNYAQALVARDLTELAKAAAAATPVKASEPAERRYVAITLTDALRDAIETAAADADTTPGLFCRDIIAQHLGVTITVNRTPAKVYLTEADKKAAQAKQRMDMAELKARLVAEHKVRMNGGDDAAIKTAGDAAVAAYHTRSEKAKAAKAS